MQDLVKGYDALLMEAGSTDLTAYRLPTATRVIRNVPLFKRQLTLSSCPYPLNEQFVRPMQDGLVVAASKL